MPSAYRIASLFFFLALIFGAELSFGACAAPKVTHPDSVKINGDSALIITHATAYYDLRYSIKYGVDAAVKWAKEKHIPVIYLIDDSPIQLYEMEDCQPDYWVRSVDGEIPFMIKASNIYLAGGHLGLCLNRTANDLLFAQTKEERSKLTYTFLMDAIYSNGKSVEEQDPYYADFSKFMGVVTYGRPGGEAAPRVSLLEVIGSIKNIGQQYDYLSKILPRWDRSTSNDYEILLQMKDLYGKTLRKVSGFGAKRIEFLFVESASALN